MASSNTQRAADAPTRKAVVDRLDQVHDPELDRSIVELEYIDAIEIAGGSVHVAFVLPTAWCSPAFAWMMATGIRDEVGALDSVETVSVDLEDHMHAAEINHGVNEGLAFEDAFQDADDGIEAVREKLDEKARLARQFHAFETLRDAGVAPAQIAGLRRSQIDLEFQPDRAGVSLRDEAVTVTVPRQPLADYLEKAHATGVVDDTDDRVFADREGDPVAPADFAAVRRRSRVANANITGQGAICSALHESRND